MTYHFDKSQLKPPPPNPADPSSSQAHRSFDDNDMLKPAKAFHIEKVIVYFNRYIAGLSVVYKLDGKNKRTEYLGSTCTYDTQFEKLILEEFEHIEFVGVTYSQRGLHSITFKTNTGRGLICNGDAGKGTFSRELNLREHNKGVIGFRGLYSSHFLDLYIYISLRLDIISETANADSGSPRRRSSVRRR